MYWDLIYAYISLKIEWKMLQLLETKKIIKKKTK